MKLIFLGSGSIEFDDFTNFQSNMLLESDKGRRLLIDCGADCRYSLDKLGLTYRDIHEVLITRVGLEQSGGLIWLGMQRMFNPECKPPILHLDMNLHPYLWDHYLSAEMESIQSQVARLETFFDVRLMTDKAPFSWDRFHFTFFRHSSEKEILGVAIDDRESHILICFENELFLEYDVYEKFDIIFQSCRTRSESVLPQSHIQALAKLPDTIKSKMWLYHFDPGELPNAKDQGFLGFVSRGQEFAFLNGNIKL